MKKITANRFELSFILALSVLGGCIFTFLFGLSVFTAIGIILVLVSLFSGFYFAVQFFISLQDIKPAAAKKKLEKKEKANFVALGENNNIITTSRISNPILRKVEVRQVEIKKPLENKNPMEQFKENPIGELENARDQIIKLLDQTRISFQRIENIFGERMHKNTRTDIQNFLYLKQLNESLEKRLAQVIDALDQIEKNNTLNLKRSFDLVHGPLSLPKDSFSTLKSDTEVPPLPREEWEQAIFSTLKKLSRKKTFHHALNFAIYN